jgi:uncharacterized membrane protein
MPNYFLRVSIAFLEPVFHAWCNVIDSYFSNKVFNKLSIFIFIGTVFNLIFVPIIIIVTHPIMPPLWAIGILMGISLVGVFYVFSYYWSMRSADASVVASLFSVGKIFLPIMAYFIVGERLTSIQYFGFSVIVISVTVLNFDIKKFRVNKALLFMVGVSLITSLEAVMYKYVFDHGISWGTVTVTEMIMQTVIAGIFAVSCNSFVDWYNTIKLIIKNWRVATIQQVFEWVGNKSETLALSLIPVSVGNGILATTTYFCASVRSLL